MRILAWALVAVFGISLSAEASVWLACKDAFDSKRGVEKNYVSGQLAILYFASHVEVLVKDTIYNPMAGYQQNAARFLWHSSKSLNATVWLKATEKELQDIEQYIVARHRKPFQTCVSGSCRAPDYFTGLIIPFPFNQSPALSFLFFQVSKKLGFNARIEKIDLPRNKNRVRSLVELCSVELFSTLCIGGVGGAIYGVADYIPPVQPQFYHESKPQPVVPPMRAALDGDSVTPL